MVGQCSHIGSGGGGVHEWTHVHASAPLKIIGSSTGCVSGGTSVCSSVHSCLDQLRTVVQPIGWCQQTLTSCWCVSPSFLFHNTIPFFKQDEI